MNKKNNKNSKQRATAWIFLIVLTIALLTLNYVKFFMAPNPNIEEYPTDQSSETAIQIALEDIVRIFNEIEELKEDTNQNVKMKSILNQHSIFISYTENETITYEFYYSNLKLNITVDNSQENLEKFHQVYKQLIKATQKRINNEKNNIDEIIDDFLNKNLSYDGLIKKETETTITYQVDITKKLMKNEEETE